MTTSAGSGEDCVVPPVGPNMVGSSLNHPVNDGWQLVAGAGGLPGRNMASDVTAAYRDPRTDPETPDPSALLEALDDPTCRTVLNELRDCSLTAQEISATCDIPQSTAYRKLDLLTEAGLLDPTVRVAPAENNPTEYRTAADGATIRLDSDGDFEVSLTECQTAVTVAADD